jgi:hypothetical protein
MQRLRRARRAVVFHDDRLANEEELVKKKRLEISKKKRRTNPHIPVPVESWNKWGLTLQINNGRLLLITGLEITNSGNLYSTSCWILARQVLI